MWLIKLNLAALVAGLSLPLANSGLFGHCVLADKPQELHQPRAPKPAVEGPTKGLSPAHFSKLHSFIQPQPGEAKWAKVAWLTSLDEARKRSVAEDKPIFLWRAGGGDVLGRA
jgi:hypothetical protein